MGSWLLSCTGKGSTCWRDLIIWKIFSVPKSYPKCKRPVVNLGVGISKTSGNSFLKWAVAEQEWKRWCRVSICPQNGQNWIEGSSWYCCHLDNWEPVAMDPVNRFTSMTVHPGEMFQEVCVFLSNQCGRSVGVLNVVWIVWQWFDGNLQSQIQDQPRSSSKMNIPLVTGNFTIRKNVKLELEQESHKDPDWARAQNLIEFIGLHFTVYPMVPNSKKIFFRGSIEVVHSS